MRHAQRKAFWALLILIVGAWNAHATTWYVSPSGSDANAGTQAAPFLTIAKALASTVNGDTILVANGVYTGAGNVNLRLPNRAITLKSENGAGSCIIDGDNRFQWLQHWNSNQLVVIDGFTVENGKGFIGGGGIQAFSASLDIRNCVFQFCTAKMGGGVGISGTKPSTITNCLFVGNTATTFGSAISTDPGTMTPTVVTNCTFSGNGVTAVSGTFRLVNSIVWDNGTTPMPADLDVTYSDIQGGYPGEGNIAADPQWLNADMGGYSLTPASHCILAGNPSAVPTGVTTDLAGEPRVLYGRVSMGAYEVTNLTLIDTDALTINGSSTGYRGVPMIASLDNGVAEFGLYGDFAPPSGTFYLTGSRPLRLLATNNITLSDEIRFDASGFRANAVLGGGDGGLGRLQPGPLGGRATGGGGGSESAGGPGGSGNGASSRPGFDGLPGANGFGLTSGGGAGATGTPADMPIDFNTGGTAGAGGAAGTPLPPQSWGGGRHGGNGGNGGSARGGIGVPAAPAGGSGGLNGGSGTDATGGGGGGAGGGGRSGASGGSGGGGGGGGSGASITSIFGDIARGGNGGAGGKGGDGGDAGDGAAGGGGGNGGGVIILEAFGKIDVSAMFLSQGGAGRDAQPGGAPTPAGTGEIGFGGGKGGDTLGYSGGAGGGPGQDGASSTNSAGGGGGGGRGGNGGTATAGTLSGAGGGGAGGTIVLFGSIVTGSPTVDTVGGPGGGTAGLDGANSGTPGGSGRFLVKRNADTPFNPAVTNASRADYPGLRMIGLYAAGLGTPFIPNLPNGAALADLSGLAPSAFPAIVSGAPANASAAVARFHTGPAPLDVDFPGFDYLVFINLRGQPIAGAQIGVGGSTSNLNVLTGNGSPYHPDSTLLPALDAGAVWVTLVPTSLAGPLNVGRGGPNPARVSTASLTNGGVFYVVFPLSNGSWYVDRVAGNDANAGTAAAPFKTLAKALSVAQLGDAVFLKAGDYPEHPRITQGVRLQNWGGIGTAAIGKP